MFLAEVLGGALSLFLISLGIARLWGAIQQSPVSLRNERLRWLGLEIVFLVLLAIGLFRSGVAERATTDTEPAVVDSG
jgi:hypothetical protein